MVLHPWSRPGPGWVSLLCLLAALLMGDGRALAQDALFRVDGVKVDKTAKNSNVARDQAIAQGRMKAWNILIRRVTPKAQHGNLPKLKYKEVVKLVREYQIEEEKASSVRYIATLQFLFDEQRVRAVLQEHGLSVVSAPVSGKPVVVLPIFDRPEGSLLWEEENSWRLAWAGLTRRGGFVQLVVPLGDLADIQSITIDQALAADNRALNKIAGRYGAGGVAVIRLSAPGEGKLSVSVTPWVLGQKIAPFKFGVKTLPGQEIAQQMAGAVNATAKRIDDKWKGATVAAPTGERLEVAAGVVVATLAEWVEIRTRLETIPMLTEIQVISLQPGEARVNLVLMGELSQFEMALDQLGLALNQGFGDLTIARVDGGPLPEPGLVTGQPGAAPDASDPTLGQPVDDGLGPLSNPSGLPPLEPAPLHDPGLDPTKTPGMEPLPPLDPPVQRNQAGNRATQPAAQPAPGQGETLPPDASPPAFAPPVTAPGTRKKIGGIQVEDLPAVGN